MESAARDGHVVMGSMDVGWSDLGSWTALLEAIGGHGTGAVVQAGDTLAGGDAAAESVIVSLERMRQIEETANAT